MARNPTKAVVPRPYPPEAEYLWTDDGHMREVGKEGKGEVLKWWLRTGEQEWHRIESTPQEPGHEDRRIPSKEAAPEPGLWVF